MAPWVECPIVEIDGDAPFERRFSETPDALVAQARVLLDAIVDPARRAVWPLATALSLRTGGRFRAEFAALGRRVGVDPSRVALANLAYDLAIAFMGCSTVALATADGPVLARNMDWPTEMILARASCLVRVQRGCSLAFANAGWPGLVGVVTGLSGRGFALALNAVLCPERASWTGYPVLLHLRRVLEDAVDFADARTRLVETRLAAPGLITLVGTRNEERVVVERTPTRAALREPKGDEPLVVTNEFRLLALATHLTGTTCARWERLTHLTRAIGRHRSVSDAELLYALSDEGVRQEITAQHVVARPREGRIGLWAPRDLLEAGNSLP